MLNKISIMIIITFIWIALGAGLTAFSLVRGKTLPTTLAASLAILGIIAVGCGILICIGLFSYI